MYDVIFICLETLEIPRSLMSFNELQHDVMQLESWKLTQFCLILCYTILIIV